MEFEVEGHFTQCVTKRFQIPDHQAATEKANQSAKTITYREHLELT